MISCRVKDGEVEGQAVSRGCRYWELPKEENISLFISIIERWKEWRWSLRATPEDEWKGLHTDSCF